MKSFLRVFLLAIVLSSPAMGSTEDLTPRQIYELTSPAVVMVIGYSNSGQRGNGGTGSIIHEDGFILTNAHVVIEDHTGRPYPRLTVYLKPAHVTGDAKADLTRAAKARVVAVSEPLDLALLQLDGLTGPFPVLGLDDSDRVEIGDRVVAIGHPEQGGLWTLTTGTISSSFESFKGIPGKAVFQTETGLNRGNSGGPLLDAHGGVIGINTAIARVAPDGMPITSISFSLKSNVAKQWLGQQGLTAFGNQSRPSDRVVRAPVTPPDSGTSVPAPAPSASPQTTPTTPAPVPTVPKSSSVASAPPPAKPYNLDRLVNERNRAEAEMEDMIKEMRGKFSGRER